MKLEGTKTEINLLTAFAGESQARNRYTFDASIAKKEGYVQVSEVFKETAGHEKEHAERLFKLLKEGGATPELKIEAGFPTGPLGGTEENLRAAAAGEKYEFTEMYPGFDKRPFYRPNRSVSLNLPITLQRIAFSSERRKLSGDARTAATFTKVRARPRNVQLVTMLRATSWSTKQSSKSDQFNSTLGPLGQVTFLFSRDPLIKEV